MAANDPLDDYQTVAQRIAIFRQKHPEGSLRPADMAAPFQVLNIGDQTFICVTAAAYRHPEDPAPGVGQAWEHFPGLTEYTLGSELQNAETSAWGRAIVAALAADSTKVASADEVKRAQANRNAPAKKVAATAPKASEAAPEPLPVTSDLQMVPALAAPGVHDAGDDVTNRAVIDQVIAMLKKPEATTQEIRDMWNVLSQARLLGWRVEPFGGVPADDDGKVTIGTLVAALGRAKSEA